MANMVIRKAAREAGVALWRIAKEIGISEPTMTRRMREELPADEQERILGVIEELAKEAG